MCKSFFLCWHLLLKCKMQQSNKQQIIPTKLPFYHCEGWEESDCKNIFVILGRKNVAGRPKLKRAPALKSLLRDILVCISKWLLLTGSCTPLQSLQEHRCASGASSVGTGWGITLRALGGEWALQALFPGCQ